MRGTVFVESSLARRGAEKLWRLLHTETHIPALGALTGNQAIQMAQAGLKSIYLSGWQVAADANQAGQMYPDQSLYPATAFPTWSGPSTMPFAAPTRFSTPKATIVLITSSPLSPMPRPALAVRSTPSRS